MLIKLKILLMITMSRLHQLRRWRVESFSHDLSFLFLSVYYNELIDVDHVEF